MPFGVRRFSKGTTTANQQQQQAQQSAQSLEEARDEAHSHVIEELEQVIEKDKSVRAPVGWGMVGRRCRWMGGASVGVW